MLERFSAGEANVAAHRMAAAFVGRSAAYRRLTDRGFPDGGDPKQKLGYALEIHSNSKVDTNRKRIDSADSAVSLAKHHDKPDAANTVATRNSLHCPATGSSLATGSKRKNR